MIFAKNAIKAFTLLALVGNASSQRSRSRAPIPTNQYTLGFYKSSMTAEVASSVVISQSSTVSVQSVTNENMITVSSDNDDDLRSFLSALEAQGYDNIDVQVDEPAYALGWPDKEEDNNEEEREGQDVYKKGSLRARLLAEQEPFGINMVEANQVDELGLEPQEAIKVCVVDTGYQNGHEDLPTLNNQADGYNPYSDGSQWYIDGHGHGTHCAGTIGAIGGNNEGVTSCNPNPDEFSFFIGKGLSDSGGGSFSAVMDAVQACVTNGAKIVSMSLGGGGFNSIHNDAYKEHYSNGVLLVAAAGNGGSSAYGFPASYPYLMSVAAVDSNKNKASFSQYNDQVEIAAPGVSVLSTLPGNNYASWSGTSMACPHVAGVAALVWSYFPECDNNQIRNVLLKTAEPQGGSDCNNDYGFGIVKAKQALELLVAGGCEAGGPALDDPSEASLGGCDQVTGSNPPTPAPTPCQGKEMTLELTTDFFGFETSWDVKDNAGTKVGESEITYSGSTNYVEGMCLADECYTFTIYDSYGDGLTYGSGGSYTLSWDGNEVFTGGDFEYEEATQFGACGTTFSPTPADTYFPTPSDGTTTKFPTTFVPTESGGGTEFPTSGDTIDTYFPTPTDTIATDFPTLAVDTQFPSSYVPTASTGIPTSNDVSTELPTDAPTPADTKFPVSFVPTDSTDYPTPSVTIETKFPTSFVPTDGTDLPTTSEGTGSPTAGPSNTPTAYPSAVPTATPSAVPTATPSAVPTVTPTAVPTVTPSAVPTAVPTVTPSAVPTAVPSVPPSAVPTAVPTVTPSAVPTAVPTDSPSVSPSASAGITSSPTSSPTASPTASPTGSVAQPAMRIFKITVKAKKKKGNMIPEAVVFIKDDKKKNVNGALVRMTITNTVNNSDSFTEEGTTPSNGKVKLKFKKQPLDEIVRLTVDEISHPDYQYDSSMNKKVNNCEVFTEDCPYMEIKA